MWMHQVVETTGSVKPCCMAVFPNAETRDEWKNFSFKKGIKTELYNKARSEMENGIWPSVCDICKNYEEEKIKSHREISIEKYGIPDKVHLKYLDIKFTNTCNLACRMCKPSDSSIIAEKIQNLSNEEIPKFLKDNYYIPPEHKFQTEKKVEYTKIRIVDGLEVLKVTGGEPLACKYFMEIIDWCVDKDYAKNLKIEFTTNLTKINRKLLDKLSRFKSIDITISADGTERIYDYIREGADWTKFSKNIELLTEYVSDSFYIKIAFLLQFYNVLDYKNMIDFADNHNIPVSLDYMLRPTNSEIYYNIINEEIKDEAVSILNNYKNDVETKKLGLDWRIDPYNQQNIKKLEVAFSQPLNINQQHQLYETVCKQDRMYNKSYKDYLHPKQINFLNSVKND
jgi:molybdenum cofactor biosynthesis enzyme MoaA